MSLHLVNAELIRAIDQRLQLRCTYHGKPRLIEPQCYGVGHRGTELLRVHQRQGGSQLEPLFDVAKIEGLVVLDAHFTQPGPNYKKDDSAMQRISAQP